MTDQLDLRLNEQPEKQDMDSLFSEVQAALDDDKSSEVKRLLQDVHPADLADIIEQFPQDKWSSLVGALKPHFPLEVLVYLEKDVQDSILGNFSVDDLVKIIPSLDSDDAVDLLESLDDIQVKQILATIPAKKRAILVESLTFPEGSAGRLMQSEIVAVPAHWTVGQTIDYMRVNKELPRDFYKVFVVDSRFRPLGEVPLPQILQSGRHKPVRDLMADELHVVNGDMPEEEVGYLFKQYDLLSAPVVNQNGRLIGRVTVDDVLPIIDAATESDLFSLSGVGKGDMFRSLSDTAWFRFRWLFLNLITAIVASIVIGVFEQTIATYVALAVLMPIVASMGGNAGTQTLAVVVRGLATKDVTRSNMWRMIGKEWLVGIINGLIFAVIGGLIAWLWFDQEAIGLILAFAMVCNLSVATLSGVVIPMILQRFNVDPAVASSVFLTTITDVVGFASFLGLAAWFLV